MRRCLSVGATGDEPDQRREDRGHAGRRAEHKASAMSRRRHVDLRIFDQLFRVAQEVTANERGPSDQKRRLTENLKALHLPAMRDCFEQAARQAEERNTGVMSKYFLG